ncbi:uncharacterized protein LOC122327524 [Puntigrus tetrazona]|uniref:uncharacterized protein LOC122327524 n=1 Tax=Puntigrus tetrazona TaxID=1606681 RepID=UPI001C8A4C46|nr:uncharacterized protein LOC122327524 [Puntigrus tetrazona]
MRTAQLLLFCLLVCHTMESLTDKRVNLGGNITLDCPLDVKEIYWLFQRPTDSPVIILRTFSSEFTSSFIKDQRLKDKYSSLTLSRLFIRNLTINELGIYYCAKPNQTLQISDGTRLHSTESPQDQKQTENKDQEQQYETAFEFHKILTVASILLNFALIIAIIGLFIPKLKKSRQSRQRLQNVPLEQIEDLNNAQYSEIELPTYSRRENPVQMSSTYVLLQKPTLHPGSTRAEINASRILQSSSIV